MITFLLSFYLINTIFVSEDDSERFDLVRAALPHLRLMTLPMEEISQLTEFLLPDEKAFLSEQVFFKADSVCSSDEVPPGLNANRQPRNQSIFGNPYTLELIPKKVLILDHYKMIGQDVDTITGLSGTTKFCCLVTASQNCCLKAVDILSHANDYPDLRRSKDSKRARY